MSFLLIISLAIVFGIPLILGLTKFGFIENEYRQKILCVYGFILMLITSIYSVRLIEPGTVGVVVNLLGNKKGVEDKELNVGIHFVAPWKNLYRFPIYEQNHTWSGDDGFNFQTSEGLSVHADVGITFNLLPDHIHDLFCKYRKGMDEITNIFIRNYIRDGINRVASKMKIEDLYGSGKEQFFETVQEHVQKDLGALGFHISKVYIIGRFHVPDNVMEALNKKIEATQLAQQRENELREAEASAKKSIAISEGRAQSLLIESKAKAEANKLLAQSVTKDLNYWGAIQKWDGKLPNAVGGSNMMIPFNP